MPRAATRRSSGSFAKARLVVTSRRSQHRGGPALDDRRKIGAEISVLSRHLEIEERLVTEDGALAGFGEDDELVAEIAADRS
jgi:hypothetical protein